MTGRIAVVLHDVAPATWPACKRVLQCIAAIAPMPVTLLVVPRYHRNPPDLPHDDWLAWLNQAVARGDELALHGYTHLDEGQPRGPVDRLRRRWYTAGEGEFSSLSHTDAAWRLKAGMRWFQQHGWPLHGFVAPAWLMSPGTWEAIRELQFAYTCTLSRLFELPSGRSLQSQSIVYSTRAGWRRALSVPWNASVAYRQRNAPLLRFELHPDDADYDAVRASWTGLLREALKAGRRPVTLDQVIREMLPENG